MEQLDDGTVTLWFEEGSLSNWDETARTYTDGENSDTVLGAAEVILKFGDDSTCAFESLQYNGAFLERTSEKIFEDKSKGLLA